jgi:5-methylcytosine-specific restriction endonuclease McrA
MTDCTTKVCRKCDAPRPLDSFTIDTRYRDGRYPWCFDCRRAWRQARKDKQRALHRNWSDRNREHVRKKALATFYRHKERYSAKRREYDRHRWHTDPAYRAKKNQWKYDRIKTDPALRERRRLWGRLSSHRRRAREQALSNTLTPQEWREILREQNYTCLACGRKFNFQLRPTMDHIAPLSKMNPLTKENCQALCKPCNSRKGAKHIDYRPLKQASFLDGGA